MYVTTEDDKEKKYFHPVQASSLAAERFQDFMDPGINFCNSDIGNSWCPGQ